MTDHIAVLEGLLAIAGQPELRMSTDEKDAIRAAIALMRGQSWQPIETAPKDGIAILGYSDGAMATVRWCALGNYWELVVVGGWAEDDEWEPTHWQHLPASPKDTADEQCEMREFGALDVENLRSLREVVAGTEHWAKVVSLDRAIALLARTEAGADGVAEPFGYFDSQGLSHAGNSTNFRWLLEQHREGKPNWGNLKLLYTHPQDASGDAEIAKRAARVLEWLDTSAAGGKKRDGYIGDTTLVWSDLLKQTADLIREIVPNAAAMQAKEAPNRSAMMRDDEMRGSECEKACDYWLRFKEQDGGMSPWYRCSLEQYARARRQHDSDTCVTKKGETP